MLQGKQRSVAVLLILLFGTAPTMAISHNNSTSATVCLNEIMVWPLHGDRYMELYNYGGNSVDMGGWRLVVGENRSHYVLQGNLAPGEHLLLLEPETKLRPWVRGDTISLYDSEEVLVDRYDYEYSDQHVPFARLPDGEEWYSPVELSPGEENGPAPPQMEFLRIESFLPRLSSPWEYVSIYNPSGVSVELDGWYLSNMRGTWHIESYTIEANSEAAIARNPENYETMTGKEPEMTPESGTMILSDRGDGLLLKDPWGRISDAVWYGDIEPGHSWIGSPAILPGVGEVARRTGETNTNADWPQAMYRKAGATDFHGGTHLAEGGMAFVSPDAGAEPLFSFINNASISIDVNVYQLTHPTITEVLVDACNRDVEVRILLDGNPVGWRWPEGDGEPTGEALQELYMLSKIWDAGGEVRFMTDDGSTPRGKRYRFNHAKYAVADSAVVLLSTENWKTSGFPNKGQEGNRGWSVILQSQSMAHSLTNVFEDDWSGLGDAEQIGAPRYPLISEAEVYQKQYVERIAQHPPLSILQPFEAQLVVGPEENLCQETILGTIDNASHTIFVQLLSLSAEWNIDGGMDNPFIDALLTAAQRGVSVKILLDQTYVNMSETGADNYDALLWLREKSQGFPFEVKLADSEGMAVDKIHTKGMVVDGSVVLLSSMNWNANSVLRNREVGVILWSRELGQYYQEVFLWDWNDGGDVTPAEETGRSNTNMLSTLALIVTVSIVVAIFKRTRLRRGPSEPW